MEVCPALGLLRGPACVAARGSCDSPMHALHLTMRQLSSFLGHDVSIDRLTSQKPNGIQLHHLVLRLLSLLNSVSSAQLRMNYCK
jgi:hypothetical protein